MTELHRAVQRACIEKVRQLTKEQEVQVQAVADGYRGYTALMMTSMVHGEEPTVIAAIVNLLLEHVPEKQVQAAADNGHTALTLAVVNGRYHIVYLLLAYAPVLQVQASDESGKTALMYAAEKGILKVVKLLLQHIPQVQVQAADNEGKTALMFAVENGHITVVEHLLAHIPEKQVQAVDNAGCTASMLASKKSCDHVLGWRHTALDSCFPVLDNYMADIGKLLLSHEHKA